LDDFDQMLVTVGPVWVRPGWDAFVTFGVAGRGDLRFPSFVRRLAWGSSWASKMEHFGNEIRRCFGLLFCESVETANFKGIAILDDFDPLLVAFCRVWILPGGFGFFRVGFGADGLLCCGACVACH